MPNPTALTLKALRQRRGTLDSQEMDKHHDTCFEDQEMMTTMQKKKTNLDRFSPDSAGELKDALDGIGWNPGLSDESYEAILSTGFRSKNLLLAAIAAEIACDEQPLTLRGLMYRIVSAGQLPSTDLGESDFTQSSRNGAGTSRLAVSETSTNASAGRAVARHRQYRDAAVRTAGTAEHGHSIREYCNGRQRRRQ